MVELSNVVFACKNAESDSLADIDMKTQGGECVVIAGDDSII